MITRMPGRQKAGPVKGVMDVDMESLRDFVTVCQEKKMTRAAEKLFMSKQTLSAVVKKLEREHGLPRPGKLWGGAHAGGTVLL